MVKHTRTWLLTEATVLGALDGQEHLIKQSIRFRSSLQSEGNTPCLTKVKYIHGVLFFRERKSHRKSQRAENERLIFSLEGPCLVRKTQAPGRAFL